jgi:hypothetical protein
VARNERHSDLSLARFRQSLARFATGYGQDLLRLGPALDRAGLDAAGAVADSVAAERGQGRLIALPHRRALPRGVRSWDSFPGLSQSSRLNHPRHLRRACMLLESMSLRSVPALLLEAWGTFR